MVHIDFNQYSTEDLRELNYNLVEHIKLRQQRDSQRLMERFELNDTVFFVKSNGDILEGKIVRFNQKTVTIETECCHHWRVSPQILQKSIQDELSKPSIKKPATVASIVNKPPEIPKKISRNAPCPCGSGKKYKRCCLNRTAH